MIVGSDATATTSATADRTTAKRWFISIDVYPATSHYCIVSGRSLLKPSTPPRMDAERLSSEDEIVEEDRV